MHLKIYNDYSNKSFPEDEKGEPLPWQRKNIEVAEIMVNPDSLIAELIWDLVDVISLPDEVFLDEINETWWDMVNNSFFPPFALKPCRKNARIYPYLKKIKELKISDNDHLVLGIDLFVEDVSLPKEFNSMREPHEKLLDRAFRWTPKKLEGLISNIIVNNKYENFVDEEIRNIRKRTGVIRDKADKKRYSDLFKRFASVVSLTVLYIWAVIARSVNDEAIST